MQEDLIEGQLFLDLADSFESDESRWNYKLGKARKLLSKIDKFSDFEQAVRNLICDDIFQAGNFMEVISAKKISRKERLKLEICCLLDHCRIATVEQLCKALGASIQGESTVTMGHNLIVWKGVCLEGVEVFNELETEKFIESVEISNLDFIKDTGSAPAILSSLPVATPGIIPKKGYQTPHWLPIKFEAGIRLIAMRLSCDTKQQDAIRAQDDTDIAIDSLPEIDEFHNPELLEDERIRVLKAVVQRQGQPAFRESLLEAYAGKCAVTNCDTKEVLEAAHIVPYLGIKTNHLSNGLILRSDIHLLFDLNLLSIDPDTLKVTISDKLTGSIYSELSGKPLGKRLEGYPEVSRGALRYHFNQCQWNP